MSVALLPIGLIAILQTESVASKAGRNGELALLALTQQAAVAERLALRQAVGAADALGPIVPALLDDPERCSAYLTDVVQVSGVFSFAGFITPAGSMTCSTARQAADFAGTDWLAAIMADPVQQVDASRSGTFSKASVLSITEPVFDGAGDLLGFIAISIPHSRLRAGRITGGDKSVEKALVELLTFNAKGEILTALRDRDGAPSLLPADAEVLGAGRYIPRAIKANDTNGARHIYTIAPIERDTAYVLGIWDPSAGLAGQTDRGLVSSLFPALMWLVSL